MPTSPHSKNKHFFICNKVGIGNGASLLAATAKLHLKDVNEVHMLGSQDVQSPFRGSET
jgi:hypothetical protein